VEATRAGVTAPQALFACFQHRALEELITNTARQIGFAVRWNARPLDILATPAFIRVVDRRALGLGEWATFENYCDELDTPEPTIIVDDLPTPARHAVIVSPASDSGLRNIAIRIAAVHALVSKGTL
jgi:hypothetical protein